MKTGCRDIVIVDFEDISFNGKDYSGSAKVSAWWQEDSGNYFDPPEYDEEITSIKIISLQVWDSQNENLFYCDAPDGFIEFLSNYWNAKEILS